MAVEPKLVSKLQQCIADVLKLEEFYDFTVEVKNTSFKCHRLILTACSGFFQGLFRSQMKECQQNSVNIGGMTASTFDVILNSLYKGIFELTENNVLEVWSATVQLQIGYLAEECEHFVIENISVNSCISILNCANLLSSNKVTDHAIEFILKHFEQVRRTDDFLQLPFDHFYRIIRSDLLEASSEEAVFDTVMKWMECRYNLRQCSQVNDKNTDSYNSVSSQQINDTVSSQASETKTDFDTNSSKTEIKDAHISFQGSCSESRNQNENSNDHSTALFVTESNKTECETSAEHTKAISVPQVSEEFYDSCDEVKLERDDKIHLLQLISACRLLLINPTYLESMLKNNKLLLSCRKAYNLIFEALMYGLHVERRHDPWPEAAVHRLSSCMKHMMVFIIKGEFMAYSLYNGSLYKFADLPADYRQVFTITTFDNKLCLAYRNNNSVCKLSMYVKDRVWSDVMPEGSSQDVLLAHGCHIYGLIQDDSKLNPIYLCYYTSMLDYWRNWLVSCSLTKHGNILVRFKHYILVFSTENNIVYAECCNTQTKATHLVKSSMTETTQDMTSFSHQGDVFILQRNGSLWKIVSSEITPVDFDLITQLWNETYKLRGCVVYRNQLFVFCYDYKQVKPSKISLVSHNEVFKSIELVHVKCETLCVPLVLSESWITDP